MSILEVIACIMEAEQLRKKAATESAAKDQEAETATKADAKSSAESSEKRFIMIKKIADGIYEIAGVSEDDLIGLKAAAEEIVVREEQRRRRKRMALESMLAPFALNELMDFLTWTSPLDDYIGFMDFLREGAQADQSKDNDKS